MSDRLNPNEQRLLTGVVHEINEKAWGVGFGLVLGIGLFAATNILVFKGGSDIGSHLRLLRVYFPGYTVTFFGSFIGLVYAFVLGYAVGRTVVSLYYRLAGWLG